MIKTKSKINKSDINKILIIRNDKIGDLVLSTPIISLAKKTFPSAQIDIVVSKENKQLIEENKKINKIYVLNYCPRSLKDFFEYFLLSRKIKREKYDLGIAARGSFFNIFFLLFLGRVKYKIGFYTNKISKIFLNCAYFKDFKGHATHNIVKMINKGLETNFKYLWPEIDTSEKDKETINEFIKKNNMKRFISIVIDASDETKQWPLENFDQLIKCLHKKYPKYKIILLGTDDKKMNFLLKRNSCCLSLLKKNLRHIFLLFKKSSLVIAPDGGTMHLAWAAKTNLIALISPSVILEDTKPLGEKSKFIYQDLKKIEFRELKKLADDVLKKENSL